MSCRVVWSFFQQCRMALDDVYIEACSAGRDDLSDIPSHAKAIEEERQVLVDEIQSLWDEIIPVAHMAVEKEFLKPLLETINIRNKEGKLRNSVISTYVRIQSLQFQNHHRLTLSQTSGMLRYMNQHLEVLAERIYILTLHHKALFDAYQFTMARMSGDSILDLPKSITQKPTLESDDRSSIIELLHDYFGRYGSVPIEFDPENPGRTPQAFAVSQIRQFVASRDGKLPAMYAQMQTLFEAAAKANLGNVEIGRAILAQRLGADRNSGFDLSDAIFLKDDEAEEAIRLMANEVEVVREHFKRLDKSGSGASTAPDFVVQAYIKANKRLSSKGCEGCLSSGNVFTTCPTCRGCLKFTEFVSRWSDA